MARHNTEPVMATVDGIETPVAVTIEQDTIEIPPSMLPEPDPDWTHTDEQGHEHYRADTQPRYPTLERVVDEVYFCHDCHENHERSHLACVQCGVEVEPGTRPPSPFSTFVQGMRTVSFEVPMLFDSGQEVVVEVQGQRYETQVVAFETSSRARPSSTLVATTAPVPVEA